LHALRIGFPPAFTAIPVPATPPASMTPTTPPPPLTRAQQLQRLEESARCELGQLREQQLRQAAAPDWLASSIGWDLAQD